MPSIGPAEVAIVALVALLILGPKKLPAAGRSLGSGLREFKDGITGRGEPEQVEPAPVVVAAAEPAKPEV